MALSTDDKKESGEPGQLKDTVTLNDAFIGAWNIGNTTIYISKDGVLRNNKMEKYEVLNSNVIKTKWCGHDTILCLRNDNKKLMEIHDENRNSVHYRYIWEREKSIKSHSDNTSIVGRWTIEQGNNHMHSFVVDDNYIVYRERDRNAGLVLNENTILTNWYKHDLLLLLVNHDTVLEIHGGSGLTKWHWHKNKDQNQ